VQSLLYGERISGKKKKKPHVQGKQDSCWGEMGGYKLDWTNPWESKDKGGEKIRRTEGWRPKGRDKQRGKWDPMLDRSSGEGIHGEVTGGKKIKGRTGRKKKKNFPES